MSPLVWLLAFGCMTLLEVWWVLYTRAVVHRDKWGAAAHATAIHLFSAAAVLSYTEDRRYMTATALGAFIGTWLAIEWVRRRDRIST